MFVTGKKGSAWAPAVHDHQRSSVTEIEASLVPSPSTSPARIACSIPTAKVGLAVRLGYTRNPARNAGGDNYLVLNGIHVLRMYGCGIQAPLTSVWLPNHAALVWLIHCVQLRVQAVLRIRVYPSPTARPTFAVRIL